MVRFGYGLVCVYPAEEMLRLVCTAEELGFDFCHLADDPSMQDPWAVVAAAARETSTIRLGFSATHVYLREPTLIAQALATIDQLSGGRAQAVVSFGDPYILDSHHVEWRGNQPLALVREAIGVMRSYLDDGAVDHHGEHFHYTGIQTMARPVQEHLPLFVGALGGPKSFELAGEVADGVECMSFSRENSEYVVEHVRKGAERVGGTRTACGSEARAGSRSATTPRRRRMRPELSPSDCWPPSRQACLPGTGWMRTRSRRYSRHWKTRTGPKWRA